MASLMRKGKFPLLPCSFLSSMPGVQHVQHLLYENGRYTVEPKLTSARLMVSPVPGGCVLRRCDVTSCRLCDWRVQTEIRETRSLGHRMRVFRNSHKLSNTAKALLAILAITWFVQHVHRNSLTYTWPHITHTRSSSTVFYNWHVNFLAFVSVASYV